MARIRISESVKDFCELRARTRAPQTVRQFKITLNDMERSIGDLLTVSLRGEHFDEVFAAWSESNMASTYNKKLSHVTTWLDYAHRKGQLSASRLDLLEMVDKQPTTQRRRLYLTAPALAGLLEDCRHARDRIYLAMAMNTALRSSEIISLTIADVDLEAGNLYVLRHKTRQRDVFPITQDLDVELRRWLTYYTTEQGPLDNSWFLVPAKNSPTLNYTGKIDAEDVAAARLRPSDQITNGHRFLTTLLSDAGYPVEQEGLHTIRRSVARLTYEWLLNIDEARDEAVAIVQAMLGHATPDITLKYIGVERGRERRDRVMRGKPVLSAMLGDQSNVRKLFADGT